MSKEIVGAKAVRTVKPSHDITRPASVSTATEAPQIAGVRELQHSAGNAAVTEQITSGAFNVWNGVAKSAIDESEGHPLSSEAESLMSSYFGRSFSSVRVHDDAESAESLDVLGAKAYTVGDDVVAPHGALNVDTAQGRALLAHELTHTVQQSSLSTAPPETSAAEHAAESNAAAMTSGTATVGSATSGRATSAAAGVAASAGVGVARKPDGAPKQSAEEVALYGNRYWSTRIKNWPGDDGLRALWDAKKFKEFSEAVRDYQRRQNASSAPNAKKLQTDGVVNQDTADALAASPLTPKKLPADGGDGPPTVTGTAPPPAQSAAPPPAAQNAAPAPHQIPARIQALGRFGAAIEYLKSARQKSLAGDNDAAQKMLADIDQFITKIDTGDMHIERAFRNFNGLTQTQARTLIIGSVSAIHRLRAEYRSGGPPTEGLWNYEVQSFQLGAEPMSVLAGDLQPTQASALQAYEHWSNVTLAVGAGALVAAIAIPAVMAGGEALGIAMLTQAPGLTMLAIENPIAVASLGLLVVGKVIEFVQTGKVTLSVDDVLQVVYTSLELNQSWQSLGAVRSVNGNNVEVEITGPPAPAGGAKGGTPSSGGTPHAEAGDTGSGLPAPAVKPPAATAVDAPPAAPVAAPKAVAPQVKPPAAPSVDTPSVAPPVSTPKPAAAQVKPPAAPSIDTPPVSTPKPAAAQMKPPAAPAADTPPVSQGKPPAGPAPDGSPTGAPVTTPKAASAQAKAPAPHVDDTPSPPIPKSAGKPGATPSADAPDQAAAPVAKPPAAAKPAASVDDAQGGVPTAAPKPAATGKPAAPPSAAKTTAPPKTPKPAVPANAKPMRKPPGGGMRAGATATNKTVTPAKEQNPEVTKAIISSKPKDTDYSAKPGDQPPEEAPQTLYGRVRGAVPSNAAKAATMQAAALQAGITDQVGPLKTPPTTPSVDHIVSVREVVDMDGFTQLPDADQKAIPDMAGNLIVMDKSANSSKQDRSWSQWPQASDYYDQATIQKMIAREAALRAAIQALIKSKLPKP